VRYLKTIFRAGTFLVGAAAVRDTLLAVVISAGLIAALAIGIVATAAFCKRSAPMGRLRALVRDLRGLRRCFTVTSRDG
jgi:hypothetical protein